MHELALAEEVLAIAEQQAAEHSLSTISTIKLTIGALSCVEPEALRWALEVTLENTLADRAEIQLTIAPGEGKCGACEATFSVTELPAACPQCQNWQTQILAGQDMVVQQLTGTE